MKITKIREVKTPTRGTECSAGLDFYVPAGMKLSMLPGDDVLIPSGIKVEVPHGYALIAHNRSSMATSTRALKYAKYGLELDDKNQHCQNLVNKLSLL